jgi:RimJ/RimL family protein N-acetyltransferase
MVFAPSLPIETERLRLRPFTRGDVDAVFEYRSREDVTQYLFDAPMSRESCAEVVQARVGQLTLETDGDKIFLVVERKADGAMLGEVTLILRSSGARQGELGYILHPRHHGCGYATEAARALLALGFEQARLHRIYARCDARNAASYAVMERLGMRREAHFREHTLTKGRWDEEFIYALLEQEWTAGRTPDVRQQR